MPTLSTETSPYLCALAQRVLVFDGAMGTTLQCCEREATPSHACHEQLALARPERIRAVHEAFLAAGCDVIETCTFQASAPRLAEWGLEAEARAINLAAARLARACCDTWSTAAKPRFVAGAMGPTGLLPSDAAQIPFDHVARSYGDQARALLDGGVDLLLLETAHDLHELKAALLGIEEVFRERGRRVPVQAQITVDTTGRMLLGADVATALCVLEALGADVVGLNCSTGPEAMREPVSWLARNANRPVAVLPNAGIPAIGDDGEAVYPLEPDAFARQMLRFVEDDGVRIVGGCCGTRPEHLQALVRLLRDSAAASRGCAVNPVPGAQRGSREPRISSGVASTMLRRSPRPLLVGERLNAYGSRAMKQALLAGDDDAVQQLARAQCDAGADALDLCVVQDGAEEAGTVARLARRLSSSVEAALMIDSTDAAVVARALEQIPGRPIVNSVSLEAGRARLEAMATVARRHGAALVVQSVDEQGPARSAQHKLAIARAAHAVLVDELGFRPEDLLFDLLTFTLGTGDAEWANSARETLEAIRRIQEELPGVLTVLGISNVSHGLPPQARRVLNSVFLHRAVEAGLDVAIIDPAQVRAWDELDPELRALADDLVYNRQRGALERFVEAVSARTPQREAPKGPGTEPSASPGERVRDMIVRRRPEGLEEALDAAGAREAPLRIVEELLLPAMKEVGDRFAAGELILPYVLQSAELVQRAVRHLDQFLDRADRPSRGRVVLATVQGDVHEIGKSLVATLLANNGYTVFDLGKQVPVSTIVEKAIELKADAVGLSALLASTAKQMVACVAEFDRRGLEIPILLGGAALDRGFAARAMLVDGERPYSGGVFYCRDAFDGLRVLEDLSHEHRRRERLGEVTAAAREARARLVRRPVDAQPSPRKSPALGRDVPAPPFWGSRAGPVPVDDLLASLHRERLFRSRWGARVRAADRDGDAQLEAVLARLIKSAAARGWPRPQAAYGYFPCASEGDALVIYAPEAYRRGERIAAAELRFPRQPSGQRLCLSDYFVPAHEGIDVLALQAVTLGDGVDEHLAQLRDGGEVSEAFFAHGFAAELTESCADWAHRRIQSELGLPSAQGRRYSWGYGPCPDLAQQARALGLMPEVESVLGVRVTHGHQLVPELSTAALVVHNAAAKYFTCELPSRETRDSAA